MIPLALAALAFVGIHLGVSGTTLRDRIVARVGAGRYMIGFSVASALAIVWLVLAYDAAAYVPTWGQLQGWKPVALVLMLPAFLLAVIGLVTPSPTAVGQERLAARPATGILRISRHPFLMGVALWAILHLVGNGDAASLVFFGALAVVAIAGPASIDAKRRRTLGPPAWDGFAAQTSIIPFAAILTGRNRLALREIGWWRPAAGLAAYVVVLGGHVHLFGVSPFPW